MAEYSKAWAFTASHEGDDFKGKKKHPGVKKASDVPKTDEGPTVFGITTRMLMEQFGWSQSKIFTNYYNMGNSGASAIWQQARWESHKLGSLDSQELATLIFDYTVQGNNGSVNQILATFGMSKSDYTYRKAYADWGGTKDGMACFNDKFIAYFNELSAQEQKKAYFKILTTRIVTRKGLTKSSGIAKRFACFLGYAPKTQSAFEALAKTEQNKLITAVMAVRNKKQEAKLNPPAKNKTEKDDTKVSPIVWLGAAYLGAKWAGII